jgi:hypothetical protein
LKAQGASRIGRLLEVARILLLGMVHIWCTHLPVRLSLRSYQGKELEEAVRVKGTVLASSDRLIVRVFFVRVTIAMMIKRLDV